MDDDFNINRSEYEKLMALVGVLALPCTKWNAVLPFDNSYIYRARETPLTSKYPLFALSYELWYLLDYMGLYRDKPKHRTLAQLRKLLEILWIPKGIDWICWQYGDGVDPASDRWDDYWDLVHKLAVEFWDKEPENVEIELEKYLSVITKNKIELDEPTNT